MSIEQNRATAIRFITGARDHRGLDESLVTEDCRWLMPGIGTIDKAGFRALVDPLAEVMAEFPTMTITGTTAEGDRVAVQAEGSAPLRAGGCYDNSYHFLLLFRDGLVCHVSEYTDTRHAHDILFTRT